MVKYAITSAREWTVNRMSDYIDRQAAIEVLNKLARSNFTLKPGYEYYLGALYDAEQDIKYLPSADVVPVVRCKDCVHQTKFWHNDGRMKNGGYYIYGCDLVDEYSHVCLDDDFCSRGERRDGEANVE